MTGLFSALGKAASFTARGATITFGSTIISCYAACKIEQSANRAIYHFAPHKFANVEYANGLTQEQLDAVRIYREPETTTTTATENEHDDNVALPTTLLSDEVLLQRHETEAEEIRLAASQPVVMTKDQHEEEDEKKSSQPQESAANKFWKEGEETLTNLIPVEYLSRQDILACSMTG